MLENLLRVCKPNAALARRVRVVLACAEPGATEAGVAEALGVSPTQVVTWRTLFHQRRLAALIGSRAAAQPLRADGDAVERVVTLTLQTEPPDGKPWSTRRLAKLVGISHVRVWQIWRDHGIGPAHGTVREYQAPSGRVRQAA